jgi:hypothetical protein
MTATLGLGALLLLPASAASAKSVSKSQLNQLTNQINQAKKNLTYVAVYESSSGGKTSTITFAQQKNKSLFSTSDGGSVVSNGKTTYYCSANSGNSGNSGNTGSSSNSGNTGNSGSTTATTKAGATTCVSMGGSNPLASLQNTFGPAAVVTALNLAKTELGSKLAGIKITSSSATFAGQPSTCVTVTGHGQGGKYCVTNKGVLAYLGDSSGSGIFQLTSYSSKPPPSLFQLPSGATTQTLPTLPGGPSIP